MTLEQRTVTTPLTGWRLIVDGGCHNGFNWTEGENIDPEPFVYDDFCRGGLFYLSTVDQLINFKKFAGKNRIFTTLWDVTIPEGAQYRLFTDKSKADRVILSNPRPFIGFPTIIKYVPLTTEQKLLILSLDGSVLNCFNDITERMKNVAIESYPHIVGEIETTPEQKLRACQIAGDVIGHFTDIATEKMRIAAASSDGYSVLHIVNAIYLAEIWHNRDPEKHQLLSPLSDDVMYAAIDQNSNSISNFAKFVNKEMMLDAVDDNGLTVQWLVDHELFDDDVANAALNENPGAEKWLTNYDCKTKPIFTIDVPDYEPVLIADANPTELPILPEPLPTLPDIPLTQPVNDDGIDESLF